MECRPGMDCSHHHHHCDLRSRALFPGAPVAVSLANCDMEALVQPSPEQVEAYERYLHLPELTQLWRTRTTTAPAWRNEPVVRPVLQSLELVFRMISGVLCDTRPYINRDEWLRRLESLASSQLELLSCIVEGDDDAPTSKLASACSFVGTESVVWHKSGSRPVVSRLSKDSLLPRLASWRTAQAVSARLHFAIEGHMTRAPFTLGLGEPNLAGKPVLEYDLICRPLEVYACRQSMPGHPEDHTLSTVHQMMEAWLEVASGLLRTVEEHVQAGNFEAAAKSCWVVERVWKLLISTMDLLQIMDPDDFMRLKEELAITQDGTADSTEHIGGGAYCLRSTRLRQVTKDCKELRHLVPKVVGVEADPKGGPRLQEAVMDLLHSHGMRSRSRAPPRFPQRPLAYHSSTIHLLQAFQAVEAAVRQFYFAYQQLVMAVMGSGEYTATTTATLSAADALSQIYFEPPYFPSLDGAKTFLGSYWHHHSAAPEEGTTARQRLSSSSAPSSTASCSDSNGDDHRSPKKNAGSVEKKQFATVALAYNSHHHMYQGAMGA